MFEWSQKYFFYFKEFQIYCDLLLWDEWTRVLWGPTWCCVDNIGFQYFYTGYLLSPWQILTGVKSLFLDFPNWQPQEGRSTPFNPLPIKKPLPVSWRHSLRWLSTISYIREAWRYRAYPDINMLEVSDQIAVLNKIFKRNASKFIHNIIAVLLQSRLHSAKRGKILNISPS